MAATYRSHEVTTYTSRTNTTVNVPAGAADGDVLFLYHFLYYGSGSLPSITYPAGFTALSGYPFTLDETFGTVERARVWLGYRIASSEPASYTITHPAHSTQGMMVAVQGGSGATPTSTNNAGQGGSGGDVSTWTGLTAGANSCVLAFGICWDVYGTSTPPAGTTPTFTERVDTGEMYLATGDWAAGGATGNKTHTNGNTATNTSPWHAGLVAVETAGAPTKARGPRRPPARFFRQRF